MSIKKIKLKSPDIYLGKIQGDTDLARIAHLNYLKDQINSLSSGSVATDGTTLYTSNPITTNFSNVSNTFIGVGAGQDSVNSDGCVFIGNNSGNGATGCDGSVFISSGYNLTNSQGSVHISCNTNNTSGVPYSVAIGAYSEAAESSVAVGYNAGANIGFQNVYIGLQSGNDSTGSCNANTCVGPLSGQNCVDVTGSVSIGSNAGSSANNCNNTVNIGYAAGGATSDSNYNICIGYFAGNGLDTTSSNVLIGSNVGKTFTANSIGNSNVIIGNNISLPNATSRGLNIGGVLFGINLHDGSGSDPVITASTNGSLGVGVVTPTSRFDLAASSTARASMRMYAGTAPTSPNDGDIWFTGTSLQMRIGGVTKTFTMTP